MYKNVLTYQGSKSRMVKHIIPMIPKDADNFVELFCGSAVISLNLSGIRILLNDRDKNIYNFFRVLRDPKMRVDFVERCRLSPFDRATFDEAKEAMKSDDPVYRAWGLAIGNVYSFGGMGVGFAVNALCEHRFANFGNANLIKLDYIDSDHFKTFIKYAQVENKDALEVIRNLKSKPKSYKIFFYADPPYPETSQKSYVKGYTMDNFVELLEELASIKDHRWMLSCFRNDAVEEFKDNLGWQSKAIIERAGTSNATTKEEMLYWNYELAKGLL